MARIVNVSIQELQKFADDIKIFSSNISRDCIEIETAFRQVEATLDAETAGAIRSYIQTIEKILEEKSIVLKNLELSIRQYAGFVKLLKEKSTNQHINTPKEKLCGFVNAMQIRDRIALMDSGYQTESVAKASVIQKRISTAIDLVECITGVNIKPMAGCDQDYIQSQAQGLGDLIDGQIAVQNPEKVINRNSPPPQEQIASHTLVIDDPNDPWKTSGQS